MTLFEEILENPMYADLLSKLPDDERPLVLESLKKFVDSYENNVILPIKNIQDK